MSYTLIVHPDDAETPREQLTIHYIARLNPADAVYTSVRKADRHCPRGQAYLVQDITQRQSKAIRSLIRDMSERYAANRPDHVFVSGYRVDGGPCPFEHDAHGPGVFWSTCNACMFEKLGGYTPGGDRIG